MAHKPFWYCVACGAQNHESDGECQFCECGGAECRRDNCSDPRHFPFKPEEPIVDDSVKFCPECERPNQFGEICDDCEREYQRTLQDR